MSDDVKCHGWSILFESTEAQDHRYAAGLCAICPAVAWCRNQARNAQRDYPGGLHGTWAGVLYINGRVASKASQGACSTCGAVDGKPCVSRNGNTLGQPHLARHRQNLECRICGAMFTATAHRYKFCSQVCTNEAMRRKHQRYDAKRSVA